MANEPLKSKRIKQLRLAKRRPAPQDEEHLVYTERPVSDRRLPLLAKPAVEGLDAIAWAARRRDWIQATLLQHGSILFRGFGIKTVADFEDFVRAAFQRELLEYANRSTPRTRVQGKVFTSTEYPQDQTIPLHNENAYTTRWPMKILFFCMRAPDRGGETPIADSRAVFQRIDPRIRETWARRKLMYVRNYSQLDLPWQEVFQTEDRAEVIRFCREQGITFQWGEGDRLRTRQICQAVARHPETGDRVWFNQAHLFHISNLEPGVRESLRALFDDEDLPRHVYYGDGSPIEDEILEEIRMAYEQERVTFPWREGDILLLDNMLAAHGRMPYSGPRKVVVAMVEPHAPAC